MVMPAAKRDVASALAAEGLERREAMENALASVRLEGLEPGAEALADMERYVSGEISIEEGIARVLDRVRHGEARR